MFGVDRLRHQLVRNPVSSDAKAVVTGAGSGIGRAFAVELARCGGEIVCADIDSARAAETVSLVEVQGGTAHVATVDVANRAEVESLAEFARTVFDGPPTLVVNNAGGCRPPWPRTASRRPSASSRPSTIPIACCPPVRTRSTK